MKNILRNDLKTEHCKKKSIISLDVRILPRWFAVLEKQKQEIIMVGLQKVLMKYLRLLIGENGLLKKSIHRKFWILRSLDFSKQHKKREAGIIPASLFAWSVDKLAKCFNSR